MKEVEVKAFIKNPDVLLKKLLELGCKFAEPVTQEDKIFIHKSLKYSDITQGVPVARLRSSNGMHTFTLKKRIKNELDKLELEVKIDDPSKWNLY